MKHLLHENYPFTLVFSSTQLIMVINWFSTVMLVILRLVVKLFFNWLQVEQVCFVFITMVTCYIFTDQLFVVKSVFFKSGSYTSFHLFFVNIALQIIRTPSQTCKYCITVYIRILSCHPYGEKVKDRRRNVCRLKCLI